MERRRGRRREEIERKGKRERERVRKNGRKIYREGEKGK